MSTALQKIVSRVRGLGNQKTKKMKNKNKNINFFFGQESNTIVFDLEKNIFLGYQEDYEKIHQEYGGKKYYTSQTGLSGGGYVDKASSLIEMGTYVTNRGGIKTLGKEIYQDGTKAIRAFVPIKISYWVPPQLREEYPEEKDSVLSQRIWVIDYESPLVLASGDGEIMVMSLCDITTQELFEKISSWDEIFSKTQKTFATDYVVKKETSLFVKKTQKTILAMDEYCRLHCKWRGINFSQFLELREAKKFCSQLFGELGEGVYIEGGPSSKLSIYKAGPQWFGVSKYGFISRVWDIDPLKISGEIFNGWEGDGGQHLLRFSTESVQVFVAEGDKYHGPIHLSKIEWFAQSGKDLVSLYAEG